MPFCAVVGFIAGKALSRGIKIPSKLLGAAVFDAEISSCAFGAVFPMPTCAKAVWMERVIRANNSLFINQIIKRGEKNPIAFNRRSFTFIGILILYFGQM